MSKKATIEQCGAFKLNAESIAPDKSISHRSAMFATLSEGKSVITNYLRAEDTMNTLAIVQKLGADVEDDGDVIAITSHGIRACDEALDCGNSGTGMRLFCGLLASAEGKFVLTGDKYLRKRPMRRVIAPLRAIGAYISAEDDNLAPITIEGRRLKAFDYESPVSSAQVKSALILAALKSDGVCHYKESELSRDHTERMLKGMGAKIESSVDALETTVYPLESPLQPLDIMVPADPSSGFFFAVAASIIPGAKACIKNVTLNKTRTEAYRVLEKMGAKVTFIEKDNRYESIGDICIEYAPLKAVTVDANISWLIDELPVLSIAMASAKGRSFVRNAKELRVKESDRISSVVENLRLCGIECGEFEDGYMIDGGVLHRAIVDSFGDHRIAMSFLIAGLKCGMEVRDIECIATSFPNFFDIVSEITRVEYDH